MISKVKETLVVSALALLLLPPLALGETARAQAKMQHSNPVVSAVVDGVALNLVLTTDVGGAWVCLDLDASKSATGTGVDFDYARKLLRYQLQALQRHPTPREVRVPAWNRSQVTNVAYFGLAEQPVSASAVKFFLLGANASGFLGVGLATEPRDSLVWSMLEQDYYAYAGMTSGTNHMANLTVGTASGGASSDGQMLKTKQWSEPAGPSMTDGSSNHQDISFTIHNLHFQCRKTETDSAESTLEDTSIDDDEGLDDGEDEKAAAQTGANRRAVEVFGGVSGNWDAVVDFNSPCLVLPTEFYSSLTGWVGLTYNERLRMSELPPSPLSSLPSLPVLYFSLSYGARPVALPLEALVLPELQLNSSTSGSGSSSSQQQITRRLCVQRSSSIVQNGATIFAVLDSDAGTVQRYRMQGSLSLPLFNMVQAPVVLGAMAIKAIGGISVRGANRSCAMPVRSTAKLAADDRAVATCIAEQQFACVGEQQYVESTNTCQDPDCTRYYFHSLDDDSKRCVIDPAWLTTLAVTSTAFVAAELYLSTSIRRLVLGTALESTTT